MSLTGKHGRGNGSWSKQRQGDFLAHLSLLPSAGGYLLAMTGFAQPQINRSKACN